MKWKKIKCPVCRIGEMRAQSGRRGMFYRCDICFTCLNKKPEKATDDSGTINHSEKKLIG